MLNNISIIVPVLNESALINRTVEDIFSLQYEEKPEIILVDGSPYGETLDAVERKDVKKVLSEKGRARQMNKGAQNADGKILLFLHADTRLPGDALNTISSVMEKGDVVGGAFDLGIDSDRPVFRLIELAASLRSRATRVPYGDQAIFIRKDYFHAAGGFSDIPLMEDVDLMRRTKKAGDKICIISDKVMTSCRRWEKEGIVFCTLRNWTLILLYLLGVPPEKLAGFYR